VVADILPAAAGFATPARAVMDRPHLGSEEPAMTPFFIALAIACVAFWRVAVKILVAVAIFLLVTGMIMVIQDMHHIK
jgi:predicted MarR family transcription regulator